MVNFKDGKNIMYRIIYYTLIKGSTTITYRHRQYRPQTRAKGLGMTTDSEQGLATMKKETRDSMPRSKHFSPAKGAANVSTLHGCCCYCNVVDRTVGYAVYIYIYIQRERSNATYIKNSYPR